MYTLVDGTSTSVRVLRTLVNLFHIVDWLDELEFASTPNSAEQQRGDAVWMQLSSGPSFSDFEGFEENHRTVESQPGADVDVEDKKRETGKANEHGSSPNVSHPSQNR